MEAANDLLQAVMLVVSTHGGAPVVAVTSTFRSRTRVSFSVRLNLPLGLMRLLLSRNITLCKQGVWLCANALTVPCVVGHEVGLQASSYLPQV